MLSSPTIFSTIRQKINFIYSHGGNYRWGDELEWIEPLKMVIFHIMQRYFSDIFIIYIIAKAVNGFLVIQKQMTLKVYTPMFESIIGHVCCTVC